MALMKTSAQWDKILTEMVSSDEETDHPMMAEQLSDIEHNLKNIIRKEMQQSGGSTTTPTNVRIEQGKESLFPSHENAQNEKADGIVQGGLLHGSNGHARNGASEPSTGSGNDEGNACDETDEKNTSRLSREAAVTGLDHRK